MTEYGKPYEGKDFRLCLDKRQQQEVEFAEIYAQEFAHGTTGHNQLMVIYRLAKLLETAEGMIAQRDAEILALKAPPTIEWKPIQWDPSTTIKPLDNPYKIVWTDDAIKWLNLGWKACEEGDGISNYLVSNQLQPDAEERNKFIDGYLAYGHHAIQGGTPEWLKF